MRFTGIPLATLVGGFVLALATPAAASGTTHFNNPEQCFSYHDLTVCASSFGQYNDTLTPSGNVNVNGKSTSRYTATAPGYSYSSSYDYKYHFLVKQGETHQQSSKSVDTFTVNGQTCTYTDRFHYANGKVQYSQPEISCS